MVLFCRITIPQNLAFLGLSYSSPIVVCAMGLMLPSLSFILSVILRYSFFQLYTSNYLHFLNSTQKNKINKYPHIQNNNKFYFSIIPSMSNRIIINKYITTTESDDSEFVLNIINQQIYKYETYI